MKLALLIFYLSNNEITVSADDIIEPLPRAAASWDAPRLRVMG